MRRAKRTKDWRDNPDIVAIEGHGRLGRLEQFHASIETGLITFAHGGCSDNNELYDGGYADIKGLRAYYETIFYTDTRKYIPIEELRVTLTNGDVCEPQHEARMRHIHTVCIDEPKSKTSLLKHLNWIEPDWTTFEHLEIAGCSTIDGELVSGFDLEDASFIAILAIPKSGEEVVVIDMQHLKESEDGFKYDEYDRRCFLNSMRDRASEFGKIAFLPLYVLI